MKLSNPGPAYSQQNEAQTRAEIERADAKNIKQGTVFDEILIRDKVTNAVVTLTVESGVVVLT